MGEGDRPPPGAPPASAGPAGRVDARPPGPPARGRRGPGDRSRRQGVSWPWGEAWLAAGEGWPTGSGKGASAHASHRLWEAGWTGVYSRGTGTETGGQGRDPVRRGPRSGGAWARWEGQPGPSPHGPGPPQGEAPRSAGGRWLKTGRFSAMAMKARTVAAMRPRLRASSGRLGT